MSKHSNVVKAALKADGRCQYVAVVDETPWIGTSYWTMTAGRGARELLASSNLGLEPARLSVNGTVTRNADLDVPRLESIVNGERGEIVDHVRVTGRPVIVSLDLYDAYLFGDVENPAAVRRSFVDMMVAELGPVVEFRQVSPLKPLHVIGAESRGLVMPTRLH